MTKKLAKFIDRNGGTFTADRQTYRFNLVDDISIILQSPELSGASKIDDIEEFKFYVASNAMFADSDAISNDIDMDDENLMIWLWGIINDLYVSFTQLKGE